MIKNKNWHNSKKTIRTKKYLEENKHAFCQLRPKFSKASFIGFDDLQNMIEVKPNFEFENEVDFFAKDVRKKNISLLNFAGHHFMFDR